MEVFDKYIVGFGVGLIFSGDSNYNTKKYVCLYLRNIFFFFSNTKGGKPKDCT